jgi:hypothetical protein
MSFLRSICHYHRLHGDLQHGRRPVSELLVNAAPTRKSLNNSTLHMTVECFASIPELHHPLSKKGRFERRQAGFEPSLTHFGSVWSTVFA